LRFALNIESSRKPVIEVLYARFDDHRHSEMITGSFHAYPQ